MQSLLLEVRNIFSTCDFWGPFKVIKEGAIASPMYGLKARRRKKTRRFFGVVLGTLGAIDFVDFLGGNPGLVRRITFIQLVCVCLKKLVLEDAVSSFLIPEKLEACPRNAGKTVVLLTFCTCQFALACCQRHKTDVKSWHFMW